MNWENIRFFVAIARSGTLSGAAKALDVDQATVSRRLMSLEAELGSKLIERLPREARLTAQGQIILAEAVEIEACTFKIERLSVANKQKREKVTISAPPVLARHFFATNMLKLSQELPQVLISILSDVHFVSLSRLEADLAVRLSPGIKDTDIIKKIGKMDFALYAASNYYHLKSPELWEFIAYPERVTNFENKQWLDKIIGDKRVLCEMTDLSHQYETVCSGVGIAGLPCFLADKDKRLVKLEVDESMLSLDIWIAKHPDRRNDPLVVHASNAIAIILKEVGLGL
ncbi:LysR family transcriptional regulator (plasmid) [Erwinia pyri]|uniref:LysR family transcriptional regulator n=1 Tax=Erwinia pyri TaxID=3062598 RepID=A0AA50HQ79_9GAMM|nr:LysR family transcriptional regulator [Erwinia sp. DE2]WLS81112.1 LysR family transcriptional regulator [Erwinia sp. DE2]